MRGVSQLVAAVLATGVIATGVLATASCSILQRRGTQSSPSASQASPTSTLTQRWTTDALTRAFAAINNKIGSSPADYVNVTVVEGMVMVQTAANQEGSTATQYNYDGSGVAVSPTDAGNNKSEAPGQGAFPGNSIDPAAVASALQSAVRDSGENDAQVTSATIAKDNADQPQPSLIVNLNGPHGSKSLRYDLSGHLIAVL